MKFPDTQIGELAGKVESFTQKIEDIVVAHPEAQTPREIVVEAARDFAQHIIKTKLYKIIGDDRKIYGPINGQKVLQWLAEERIDPKTPVQVEGSSEWAPLEKLAELVKRAPIPIPPPLQQPKMSFKIRRPGQR